MTSDTMMCTK